MAGIILPTADGSHSNQSSPPPPIRRRRVTFCITELDPGGAERQLLRLATNLDRDLFEPEVVCLSGPGALVKPLREAGVTVTCLGARGRWDAGVLVRLWRHFRRTRPDLVQTFLFHANIAGRLAARLAGVPIVISGVRVAEPRRWHLWVDRMTDALVDRHVCVSRGVAEYSALIGGLPPGKLVVIPNAVDVARFAGVVPADMGEFGFPAGSRVVLFIGRLEPQKDPIRLLEAFRVVAARSDDARLLLVGTGSLAAELRRNSADLGGRVVLAGSREDIPMLLKAAACLALPSRWEGMPNVVLEAIAAGVPVVATDVEGVSELLCEGAGTVVQEPGVGPFAAALEATLRAPAPPLSEAVAAQSFMLSSHTTEAVVTAYCRLYLDRLVAAGLDGVCPSAGSTD